MVIQLSLDAADDMDFLKSIISAYEKRLLQGRVKCKGSAKKETATLSKDAAVSNTEKGERAMTTLGTSLAKPDESSKEDKTVITEEREEDEMTLKTNLRQTIVKLLSTNLSTEVRQILDKYKVKKIDLLTPQEAVNVLKELKELS